MKHAMVLVIDYGSQYNQLIVRRIRELGVYSELVPHTISMKHIRSLESVKGIILSGGPKSVHQPGAFGLDPEILTSDIPILGICYGMQLIAQMFGGKIIPSESREYGKTAIQTLDSTNKLFKNIPSNLTVFMSHGDQISEIPKGFTTIASSETCIHTAIWDETGKIYGVQFHPEVHHTEHGTTLLENFVYSVCSLKPTWTMGQYAKDQIESIRAIVADKHVLCGISGGVDSAVAALLVHEAIGNQLTCVFVDHGLLRKDEAKHVMEVFADKFHINVHLVDAQSQFLQKLEGIIDPEQKRKIIGHEFISVFEKEALRLGNFDFLAQGTLYTDIIESGTQFAQTIKSHHNVGGLPEKMKMKLIEPLNMLFKDEVRKLGTTLGLNDDILHRQPFPGPGLAIRIMGEITEEKIKIARNTDAILRDEFKKSNLDRSIWQYFTVVTENRSVGVMGDERTYERTVAIRAVTSVDGMTADWAKVPWDVLDRISRRIVNEVKGVNRIVYDITSKPPATIEWE